MGLCGAAPMPLELMRGFQERTGLNILERYGLTEGTCVSTVNPPQGERRLGSIGPRVPLQPMKAFAARKPPLQSCCRSPNMGLSASSR